MGWRLRRRLLGDTDRSHRETGRGRLPRSPSGSGHHPMRMISSTRSSPSGRWVIEQHRAVAGRGEARRRRALGRRRVEVRGRLVEHEHRRVREQRAGEDEALALAARELAALLADERVEPSGSAADPVEDPRPPECAARVSSSRRLRASEADVLADAWSRRGARPGRRRRSRGARPPGGSRAGRGRRASRGPPPDRGSAGAGSRRSSCRAPLGPRSATRRPGSSRRLKPSSAGRSPAA